MPSTHALNGVTVQSSEAFLTILSDPNWVRHIRASSPHATALPAGLTYLSQLLAHDMFMTEPASKVFEPTTHGADVNLIRYPLMLDAVYGRAGSADGGLYKSGASFKFDITDVQLGNGAQLVPKLMRDPRKWGTMPILADARNASTPILSQITLEFMAFHNRLVDAFLAEGHPQETVFALARLCVIRTWHNIVKTEILGGLCCDVSRARLSGWMKKAGFWSKDEYLSRGAMRCFHALVREDYVFNSRSAKNGKQMTIKETLADKARGPNIRLRAFSGDVYDKVQVADIRRWMNEWGVDWALFFDDTDKGDTHTALNRTGFTPSFSFSRKGAPIQTHDHTRAVDLDTRDVLNETPIATALQGMIAAFQDAGVTLGFDPSEISLQVALLAESMFGEPSKDTGKLGLLGSAMVRRQIDPILKNAAKRVNKIAQDMEGAAQMPASVALPHTFLTMTKTTKLN